MGNSFGKNLRGLTGNRHTEKDVAMEEPTPQEESPRQNRSVSICLSGPVLDSLTRIEPFEDEEPEQSEISTETEPEPLSTDEGVDHTHIDPEPYDIQMSSSRSNAFVEHIPREVEPGPERIPPAPEPIQERAEPVIRQENLVNGLFSYDIPPVPKGCTSREIGPGFVSVRDRRPEPTGCDGPEFTRVRPPHKCEGGPKFRDWDYWH